MKSMYILLDQDLRVKEFIPEIDETFPDIPLDQRYSPEFISQLIYIEDTAGIDYGYKFNEETKVWKYAEPSTYSSARNTETILLEKVAILEEENKTLKAQYDAVIDYVNMMLGVDSISEKEGI